MRHHGGLAGLAIAVVIGAAAAAAPPPGWDTYRAALSRQCPGKHLDLMSPSDLRDALDAYRLDAPADMRRAMDHAEARQCRHVAAGAACANLGDIRVAERRRSLPSLVASICRRAETCHGSSDCRPTAARGVLRAIGSAAPNANSLSDVDWDRTLDQAAAGRTDQIAALAARRPATDGGRSEDIDMALSDALVTNPAEVLKLIATHPELPRAPWFCEDRAIEPTGFETRRRIAAATAAVRTVRDPKLTAIRDQCLTSLRTASEAVSRKDAAPHNTITR